MNTKTSFYSKQYFPFLNRLSVLAWNLLEVLQEKT